MAVKFDPDALLAALPRREIRPLETGAILRPSKARPTPTASALGTKGEYNGFTEWERYRTADLSNWLAKHGCTERPHTCDICRAPANDEHAENYYDLASWIGLCQRCHRTLLHGRFRKPSSWAALLDEHALPGLHWARLVATEQFDLASLLRSRGLHEPSRTDFKMPRHPDG